MHLKENKTYLLKKTLYNFLNSLKFLSEYILIALITISQKKYKKEYTEKINNILIPLLHGIGDAVIYSACIPGIRQVFPGAKISVLSNVNNKEVIEDSFPDVNIIILFSPGSWRELRKNVDLMIFTSRNLWYYVISIIINPYFSVGYNYTLKINKQISYIDRVNTLLMQLGYDKSVTPSLKTLFSFIGTDSIKSYKYFYYRVSTQ